MSQCWRIEPRDPLVFGNGQASTGTVGHGPRLPAPSTVAGMVRTAFARRPVDQEQARSLLEIGIRTGWFWQGGQALVPAPVDGREESGTIHRGRLLSMGAQEGVTWPASGGLSRLLRYDPDLRKPRPLAERSPLWTLGEAVQWAVGEIPQTIADRAARRKAGPALQPEARTHVSIDSDTGTAAAGQLFTSSGSRFPRDLHLAVEVSAPNDRFGGARLPEVVHLGGEGRMSFRTTDAAAALPSFESYRPAYEAARRDRSEPRGLRLQLLTDGIVDRESSVHGESAWRPSWIDAHGMAAGGPLRPELKLRLIAAAIPGFRAISGWNLQGVAGRHEGAPRAVRRLLPHGSVFYFEWAGPAPVDPVAECAGLWGALLEPRRELRQEEWEEFRAPPALDGYGLLLPGFWFDSDCVS